MATNKEGINGLIQKLAIVSDDVTKIFPKGKSVIIYSLNDDDFNQTKMQLNDFSQMNQFKIDISGTEFIFFRDEKLGDATSNL